MGIIPIKAIFSEKICFFSIIAPKEKFISRKMISLVW